MRVPRLPDHLATSGIAPADDPLVLAVDEVLGRIQQGADLARLPAPLPTSEAFPEGRPSPRLLVLLAKALAAEGSERVLLTGEPLVAFAAVLLAMEGGPKQVVLATHAVSRARWTARRLGIEEEDRLVVLDREEVLPRGPFDRILDLGTADDRLEPRLAADGALLRVTWSGGRPTITSHVTYDGAGAEIDLTRHWIGPNGSKSIRRTGRHRTPTGATMGRILSVERMQENAWRGIAATPTEHGVLRAVRETCLGPGNEEAEEEAADRRLARRLFHLGYLDQVGGTRQGAEALYRASLAVAETAEGWTFYGWVRSQDGALQEAVDACRRAILLDATLGNPYNDIGAYLMAEGKTDEAKTWFERATQAPRYAAPHFPYTNLGRVYLREGDLHAARLAVEHALEMMPGYPPAERLLREIETREAHDPMR